MASFRAPVCAVQVLRPATLLAECLGETNDDPLSGARGKRALRSATRLGYLCQSVLTASAEGPFDSLGSHADEARGLDGGLPVHHCATVIGIGHHLEKGGCTGVARDERCVPVLGRWPDEHDLRLARPKDRSTDAREDWLALATVAPVSFRPGEPLRCSGVICRIDCLLAEPEQIQHVYGRVSRKGLESLELFALGIDMLDHELQLDTSMSG